MIENQIKIYDTTLRDGTQSKDINLTVRDKLEFVKVLDNFGIDYIELGWPGSNPKDMECFLKASDIKLKNAKIVAFGATRKKGIKADEDENLKAIIKSKAPIATIFGKSWIEHVEKQLGITSEENLEIIYDSILFLKNNNLEVFYDAEHFFDGFKNNKEYSLKCLKIAAEANVDCIILCDTNGGCLPTEILNIVKEVKEFFKTNNIKTNLGIHCHNDSDCAVSNTLIVTNEIQQIQGTINGVGERIGNANLCSILPALILKMKITTNINLKKLKEVSDKLNILANIKPLNNQPYTGENAFAHKGGVHVDALNKGIFYEHINPELVGNKRYVVLSDLSGTANIVEVAKKFGYKQHKKDQGVREMLKEVKYLEMKGYNIGNLDAEQFILIEKYFGNNQDIFEIEDIKILSEKRDGKDYNECVLVGKVDEEEREVVALIKGEKGGPVNAIYKALKKMITTNYRDIEDIKLINYKVMIAEDKGAESSVRVYIEFRSNKEEWATIGVNTNILKASLEAIEKGFKYFLLKHKKSTFS
jgi:2-isopropylmalate synthase